MTTNIHRLLPRLVVNRRLLQAVVDESRPCCALGFVEERKQVLPLIALGLREIEDLDALGDGFRLGHQVALGGGAQALRLDFEFQGRVPWQAVLDPTNLAVQRVLGAVVEVDAYFILVIGAHGATAFRADADEEERRRFQDICRRSAHGNARSVRFTSLERALHDQSTGRAPLVWIGRDDPSLLDLSGPLRHELRPASR